MEFWESIPLFTRTCFMTRNPWSILFILLATTAWSQQNLQLAPPLIIPNSVYFSTFSTVEIQFNRSTSNIYYKVASEKKASRWKKYRKPINVPKSAVIETFVKEKGLIDSEISGIAIFKQGIPIKSINISPPPDDKYPGSGERSLHDHTGGYISIQYPTWCGFNTGPIDIKIELESKKKIQKILVHCLDHPGAWIHMPSHIEIIDQNKTALNCSKISEIRASSTRPGNTAVVVQLESEYLSSSLHLRVYPLAVIPEAYPGAGQKAWLFIDEVNIY